MYFYEIKLFTVSLSSACTNVCADIVCNFLNTSYSVVAKAVNVTLRTSIVDLDLSC